MSRRPIPLTAYGILATTSVTAVLTAPILSVCVSRCGRLGGDPPATNEPLPIRLVTAHAWTTAPAAAMEATATATPAPSPLALAIFRIPSSGKPTPVMAAYIAQVIEETWGSDFDLFKIAALAHVESGFRPDAVERRRDGTMGPGKGLWQLHSGFTPGGMDPFNIRAAAVETKRKHTAWLEYHRREVNAKPHEFLVHHFCGYATDGCESGIISAAKVSRTAEELRRLSVAP